MACRRIQGRQYRTVGAELAEPIRPDSGHPPLPNSFIINWSGSSR